MKKSGAPVQTIITIRKLKTVLPSLKAPVAKPYKGWVVYQITCSRCQSCYVGQTARHLLSRIREHRNANTPVGNHFTNCNVDLTMDDVKIIARSNKSEFHLMALEALCIQAIKPSLNTKDEYKSRTLVIRIWIVMGNWSIIMRIIVWLLHAGLNFLRKCLKLNSFFELTCDRKELTCINIESFLASSFTVF